MTSFLRAAIGTSLLTIVICSTVPAQSNSNEPLSASPNKSVDNSEPNDESGIAVVELFTSQGCNSCPPADAVLKQISDVSSSKNVDVYTLSFHVDYWNRLGWSDPYSSPQFSKRQGAYASASGSRRVYTPQMIVSGSKEFVGSNKALAHQSISASLNNRPKHTVKLTADRGDSKSSHRIDYQVSGDTNGKLLNIAVVATPPPNKVSRGENSGRTLAHVNVVRVFRVINLQEREGSVELSLPSGLMPKEASVIGYVQDQKGLQITGATKISLRKNASR